MKFKNLNYLTIITYLISSTFAYSIELPDIKNIIIHKEKKKISHVEFYNSKSKKVILNDYNSKLVIINFWATWCAPCKKEMVFLDEFEKEYKKEGFSVLSVSIDNQKSLSQVRSYVRVNNYSFDVFLDPNMQVFKKMNGNLMPTNILLDQNGNIIWRHYGYLPGDENNMNLQIRSALNLNS